MLYLCFLIEFVCLYHWFVHFDRYVFCFSGLVVAFAILVKSMDYWLFRCFCRRSLLVLCLTLGFRFRLCFGGITLCVAIVFGVVSVWVLGFTSINTFYTFAEDAVV